jgi:ABC-type sugar transport system substrate-binding protein
MAMGARKAFSEIAESERARWMKIPITGCDGMPKTGQTWVRNGTLAATIFIRQNTDLAIEMLVDWFKSGAPLPERKVTEPESVPSLQDLAKWVGGKMQRSAGV